MSFGGSDSDLGALSSDSDVALSNPTNGQVLSYNVTLAKWQNQTGGAGGTGAATHAGAGGAGAPGIAIITTYF